MAKGQQDRASSKRSMRPRITLGVNKALYKVIEYLAKGDIVYESIEIDVEHRSELVTQETIGSVRGHVRYTALLAAVGGDVAALTLGHAPPQI